MFLSRSRDSFYIILNCAPIVNPFFSNFIRKKEDGKSTVLKSAYKRESVPYETEFDAFDFGGAEGNFPQPGNLSH